MNFCTQCGDKVASVIPAGEDRPRGVCQSCGFIHYENPKMVVGCIPVWQDEILLVRRAIEPRLGLWTLPAGYLENGETMADGARRETTEEAGADSGELFPYGLYNLTRVNQIYMMFRTELLNTDFRGGVESLEVKLFTEANIPWDEMAFKVMHVCLERFLADRKEDQFPFHTDDIIFQKR
ncbi:MAG: NUDIX hydrolase [Deltaproteobacteria bacterium]|nr:NUDIX hydrolase [Deltaproteobacteria bacterium]MBT4262917.1 NUDIX hydrolase [Deltaproteobacteria bacterium]MBT4641743.1 NUDIX hydrolase [Deltaproteobacteria bacterium]MBT6502071.1 NUDIX hydrolase [Deltaproteobacteria bacterium]MBT6614084.1 NUDIX hydrolase [Deltaproteobacteria bacterium]